MKQFMYKVLHLLKSFFLTLSFHLSIGAAKSGESDSQDEENKQSEDTRR